MLEFSIDKSQSRPFDKIIFYKLIISKFFKYWQTSQKKIVFRSHLKMKKSLTKRLIFKFKFFILELTIWKHHEGGESPKIFFSSYSNYQNFGNEILCLLVFPYIIFLSFRIFPMWRSFAQTKKKSRNIPINMGEFLLSP